jgi:hypothetical protein
MDFFPTFGGARPRDHNSVTQTILGGLAAVQTAMRRVIGICLLMVTAMLACTLVYFVGACCWWIICGITHFMMR